MAQYRKDRLENNYYYHIFTRSIAKYVVFDNEEDYFRFMEIIQVYRHINFNYQYSKFIRLDPTIKNDILSSLKNDKNVLVDIIAFCIMPTHIHLVLRQISDQGISKYMGKILNSYARYFNLRHKRIGPLWSGRFKSVLVENDEQLLHLTRYIYLNPTSAELVEQPEDWLASSFKDYIDEDGEELGKSGLFSLTAIEYKKFVLDRKDYQKELSKIKNIILDDSTP